MAVVAPHVVPEGCPVPVQAPCRETRSIAGRQEDTKVVLCRGRTARQDVIDSRQLSNGRSEEACTLHSRHQVDMM